MSSNFPNWFYEQHKYLTGSRDGEDSYNDTKWVNINKRFKTLMEKRSQLLNEQPFGVVGNDRGFDKLIDLLSRSNYTFDDINDSLIDTYRVSLKNAMGRMMVNTEAMMFRCLSTDKEHVSIDNTADYYIIDVPFNQLHFGDRDEFIRQKLHKMHNTSNNYYMPINDFITNEITSLLGFTIICTVNGFISNDCQVAVDDKGFKFKIRWLYSSTAEFIIYKLDEAFVHKYIIDSSYITNGLTIPYSDLGNLDKMIDVSVDRKCLINIYDENFSKTMSSVPNFCVLSKEGLNIKNLQQRTIDDINSSKSKSVTIVIYSFKHFHEIPNVYPAVNFYDIIDTRKVYTDEYDNVKDTNHNRILSSDTGNINRLEVCTPPIVLDRSVNLSFKTITSCLNLYDTMMDKDIVKAFHEIGSTLQQPVLTEELFMRKVVSNINNVYDILHACYIDYIKGSILTSLVHDEFVDKFKNFIIGLDQMRKARYDEAQRYTIDEFYGDNYQYFVQTITTPFRHESLSNFTNLDELSKNYFVDENSNRFNRPISEQCFITLMYNRDEKCWLFAAPTIKHFKGIGNTFYIDDNLDGDEVFKFFVLYTDTESPSEHEVSDFNIEHILDFDMFCKEVDKHVGYIRYWDVENKLLKISKVMYDKYDEDTTVQVLSKILKHKIDSGGILDIYPSDINYEPSNITSDNIISTEDDDRGPFSINFLFYTMSMLYDNEDKLQTYFFHHLTDNKFCRRYSDINIDSLLANQYTLPVNYSQFSIAPITIDESSSKVLTDTPCNVYYGLPVLSFDQYGNPSNSHAYRYTFNVYDNNMKYYLLSNNGIDTNHYVQYTDLSKHGYQTCLYHDDIYICKLMTFYLNDVYDCISGLQTDYIKPYDQTSLIDSAIESIKSVVSEINDFVNGDKPRTFIDRKSVV